MRFRNALIVGLLSLCCAFASCDPYRKALTKGTLEEKWTAAMHYYNKKDYLRAQPLFEDLISVYRGTPRAEEIYYYYAYTHFGQGAYTLAAYHFKNYATSFPNAKHTEESEYMYAYSLALESPPLQLDQENTERAIDAYQLFLNRYPDSERLDTSNVMVQKLRRKLELKAYNGAYLYYKIEDYRAAAVAMKSVLKEFPDIAEREKIEYMIFRSYYEWAQASIVEKRAERFTLANESLALFKSHYPQSTFLREADRLGRQTELELRPRTTN